MITYEQVHGARDNKQSLRNLRNGLVVDKMKLDKFFSIFLDSVEMDLDDTTTPEWITYKQMIKEYHRVERLITTTDYYLN